MRGGIVLDGRTGRPVDERGEPVTLRDLALRAVPAELRGDRERQIDAVLEHLERSAAAPDIRGYTRNKHYVSVRSVATGGGARAVGANLWNPHATSRFELMEIWLFVTTAGSANWGFARTTARGTASTTTSMAINNSILNDTAAPSGAVIDTAWSVAPTVSAATNGQGITPAAIGNGIIIPFPDPIDVPAGTGYAVISTQAVALPVSDITFVFGD